MTPLQQIEPALPAILGHKSEHSLATGPVIPDPFISPFGFTITPALSARDKNIPTMLIKACHMPKIVERLETRLTFEIKEMAFSPADCLALADDHCLKHLFPELGLTLLD